MPQKVLTGIVLIAALAAGLGDPVRCSGRGEDSPAARFGVSLSRIPPEITVARSASEGMELNARAFPRSCFGLVWTTIRAQIGAATESAEQQPAEAANRQQKRRAVILVMLVAGIALTGLLLLIAAIVLRGFLREAQHRAEVKRQVELKRSAAVLKEAVEKSPEDAGDSLPLSERETEVT
jgi:hypothetical protein